MIEILLATYQGEQFLAEQIESILGQSYSEWILLIHDDGSSDGTIEIAKKYALAHPSKINIIQDGVRTGGAKKNFSHLLSKSSADYVMFCDQDDVWMPTKIEISFAELTKAEQEFGGETPIGVFSDYRIVDSRLNTISESGWKSQQNGAEFSVDIRMLAVRNCITGCTMMVNRAALSVALPIPDIAVMHDWWLGLSILKFNGALVPIDEPLLLYRQHSSNVVGSKNFDFPHLLKRFYGARKTFNDNAAVYRMARRIGAVDNLSDFLVLKIFTLKKTLANLCAYQ
jgi:glycosyltransferase involved in cell wall biosynthesis